LPVFKSSRKIQLFGSSLAMTLPAMFVKANEVRKGSTGDVYYSLDGLLVVTLTENENIREGLLEILEKIEKFKITENNSEEKTV
jgi:antitoxin component of MazEF toxin-antitoxin module